MDQAQTWATREAGATPVLSCMRVEEALDVGGVDRHDDSLCIVRDAAVLRSG
jgi:hypothetical protein